MKFETLREYKEQAARHAATVGEAYTKREAAFTELKELKAEYEYKLHQSVATGVDDSAKLDTLSDKIDAAERIFRRKDREYEITAMGRRSGLTPDDLVKAWKDDYLPDYKEKIADPAAKALLDAKMAYIDAYFNYRGVINDLKAEQIAVVWTLHPTDGRGAYTYSFSDCDFQRTEETDLHYIKDGDLRWLGKEIMPRSVQYVKRSAK
ncbi:hypothetical protein ACFQZE_11645 [Paenibacillus sp. GCM10027627]|uniref:hypothetical protein n=1 Tax=unclassified Paenibacillus TaxID=185978 RepID=UPI00363699A2